MGTGVTPEGLAAMAICVPYSAATPDGAGAGPPCPPRPLQKVAGPAQTEGAEKKHELQLWDSQQEPFHGRPRGEGRGAETGIRLPQGRASTMFSSHSSRTVQVSRGHLRSEHRLHTHSSFRARVGHVVYLHMPTRGGNNNFLIEAI